MTQDQIKETLKANGFYQLWHEDNWVPPNASNPDWAGMTMTQAYALLQKKNVIDIK